MDNTSANAATTVPLTELGDADSAFSVAVFVDREPDSPDRRRLHIDDLTLWEGRANSFTMLSEPSGVTPGFRSALNGLCTAADYVASLKRRTAVYHVVRELMRSGDATALLDRYERPS